MPDPGRVDIERVLQTPHQVVVSIFEWVFVTVQYLAKSLHPNTPQHDWYQQVHCISRYPSSRSKLF